MIKPVADPLHRCVAPELKNRLPRRSYGAAIDHCIGSPEGIFYVENDEYSSIVSYCPFCGAKAPLAPQDAPPLTELVGVGASLLLPDFTDTIAIGCERVQFDLFCCFWQTSPAQVSTVFYNQPSLFGGTVQFMAVQQQVQIRLRSLPVGVRDIQVFVSNITDGGRERPLSAAAAGLSIRGLEWELCTCRLYPEQGDTAPVTPTSRSTYTVLAAVLTREGERWRVTTPWLEYPRSIRRVVDDLERSAT